VHLARVVVHGMEPPEPADAMERAIEAASALEDANQSGVDDEKTQSEGGALRILAGNALREHAANDRERARALLLQRQIPH